MICDEFMILQSELSFIILDETKDPNDESAGYVEEMRSGKNNIFVFYIDLHLL